MKIKGKKYDTPKESVVVLPRDPEDVVFKFRAVVDESDFDRLCPLPIPPKKKVKGGAQVSDTNSPAYIANLTAYAERRQGWLFLKSISATEDLDWEGVIDMQDPTTWPKWRQALMDSGFNAAELQLIYSGFTDANNLDSAKVEEAKQRFLASLLPSDPPDQSSGQAGEPPTT